MVLKIPLSIASPNSIEGVILTLNCCHVLTRTIVRKGNTDTFNLLGNVDFPIMPAVCFMTSAPL
jgi:hypothetical protein